MNGNNITLIGMPGAGKSTVGVVLAKALGYRFLDSDLEIQEQTNKRLSELEIENRVNSGISAVHTVIATGGSAVYGAEAMEHLRDISTVVYLKLSYECLAERLGDLHERGVVMEDGQTLQDLMRQRCPLYETYAHLTIDAEKMEIREIVEKLVGILQVGN